MSCWLTIWRQVPRVDKMQTKYRLPVALQDSMFFLAFPKLPGQVAFPGFYTDQLQPAKTIT
jgi:hypothetical protein